MTSVFCEVRAETIIKKKETRKGLENKGMDSVVRGYRVWLGGPGEVRGGPGRPAGWGTSSYFLCLSICGVMFRSVCTA